MNDLKALQEFIVEMNLTNSTIEKKRIIGKYPELIKMFNYIFNTINKTYGITSENLIKRGDLVDLTPVDADNVDNLYSLLDELSERRLTGHKALSVVNGFIAQSSLVVDAATLS